MEEDTEENHETTPATQPVATEEKHEEAPQPTATAATEPTATPVAETTVQPVATPTGTPVVPTTAQGDGHNENDGKVEEHNAETTVSGNNING